MEEQASSPNEQVANKADEKDGVMSLFPTGLDAQIGKIDEEEVCEGVHYLGGIRGRVVVLAGVVSVANGIVLVGSADFFAPVDGGGDWVPIATSWVTISD